MSTITLLNRPIIPKRLGIGLGVLAIALLNLGWLNFNLAPTVIGNSTENSHLLGSNNGLAKAAPQSKNDAGHQSASRILSKTPATNLEDSSLDSANGDSANEKHNSHSPIQIAPPHFGSRPTEERCTKEKGTRRVYFERASSDLNEEAKARINRFLRMNSPLIAGQQLTIEGHTDRRGSRAKNAVLGLQRAQAVARHLREQGVTVPFKVQSFGALNPVAPPTPSLRWRNRRVALCLTKVTLQ